MNHLQNLTDLRNCYYAMRHGQSKANLQNIVISHPENGLHEDFALSELGRKQAKSAATKSLLTDQTVIYCSDFSRALETAHIVQEVLGIPTVHISKKLRERHFGKWEKLDQFNVYQTVWGADRQNANHTQHDVESVNAVLGRATSLILDLEKKYHGKNILLVSHGDILQILQTGFQKSDPAKHRDLPHLEVAEIRELNLAT
jgi:broad specificity phosphatase PhoE